MKKKITILVCILAIILLTVGAAIWIFADESAAELTFTGAVTVEDGVPNPAGEIKEFVVDESGEYYWSYKWMAEPGMITGMSLKDVNGKNVFACTAEGCYAESVPMELEAGIYEVEIAYLTNDEAMNQFMEDNGIERAGNDPYDYKENGTWETEYTVAVENTSGMGNGYKIGLIFGVVVGIFVVVILLAVSKKGNETKCQFDERQELVRGRGFKYGFFTMMIGNAVMLFLNILEIPLFSQLEVAMTASILAGVGVFAGYCIWNDGYFALNENRRFLMIMFALIGVMNLIIGIGNLVAGEAIQDGVLSFRSVNFFCAVLFIVMFIIFLAKHIKDRKDEQA